MVLGSKSLQHMLDLARKYSTIGDCDRCMILHSNALLITTGLLELHRSVFEERVIATAEELLESGQKCRELLMLLADTARQTMEGEGQRIKDFITVLLPPSPSSWRFTDLKLSMITAGINRHPILKPLSVLSQLVVLRVPFSRSPHMGLEPSANKPWNSSWALHSRRLLRSISTSLRANTGESSWTRPRTRQDHQPITCLKLFWTNLLSPFGWGYLR